MMGVNNYKLNNINTSNTFTLSLKIKDSYSLEGKATTFNTGFALVQTT